MHPCLLMKSVFAIFICFMFTINGYALTEICGEIPDQTVWTLSGSPYVVNCSESCVLGAGSFLTIEPGVVVKFSDSGTGLQIYGTLTAIGTPDSPILFTAGGETPEPGSWQGVNFRAPGANSVMEWCVVEYATTGAYFYADTGTNLSATLNSCTFSNNLYYGVRLTSYTSGCTAGTTVNPTLTSCTIENNGSHGVYLEGKTSSTSGCSVPKSGYVKGTLENCTIRNNKCAIYMDSESTGSLNIKGIIATSIIKSTMENNTESGISMTGRWCMPDILMNTISANEGDGISITSSTAYPRIVNNLIMNNAGKGLLWNAGTSNYQAYMVCYITNNTIYGNMEEGLLFQGDAAHWVTMTNNIVSANRGYGVKCENSVPASSHNNFCANIPGDYEGISPGEGDLFLDPGFQEEEHGNLNLAHDSPLIDKGTAGNAPDTDREGNPRPAYAGYDMGAFEFQEVPGDVDLDHDSDLADLLNIIRMLAGKDSLLSDYQNGDINLDSITNMADILIILQKTAGIR